jgi:methylthioribose-1-phosphate isomerase
LPQPQHSSQASTIEPIEWRDGSLRILDQTLLPHEVRYIETDDYRVVADAIRRLAVRGAPLIGIAAAHGLALASRRGDDRQQAGEVLTATRPTAVNLRWAVERVLASSDVEAEARLIHEEQRAADRIIGELGAALLSHAATVLTHCNAGSLATGGIGTALGPIKTAHRKGKRPHVLVDETRPLLQGARLTAWELQQEGIPHEIIVDSAAAGLIARGDVSAVLVGADRIAGNGDTANKVGTYGLALAAHAHGVPFYVAAPVSTIDPRTSTGDGIVIEDRDEDEILLFTGTRTGPAGSSARNPAFDVTPARLITAIITERGVLRAPFAESIASTMRQPAVVR